jgi:hypothetical protein
MEQIASYMQADDHRATERAAAGLCIEVLTLSIDMAFLGNFRKVSRVDSSLFIGG